MALLPFNANPTRRELRQFASLWLPLSCVAVAAVLWKAGFSNATSGVVAATGAALGIVGWLRPDLFRPIFVAWLAAAYPIGWVVSHVVLAILYFGVLTPIGLTLRLFGRDPMTRRWDRDATTYWTPHRGSTDDSAYFRQY
jgi:hypothetical protein